MNLGAIDGDDADLGQPAAGAECEHLAEQRGDRVLVTLDEAGDRGVIGPLLRRHHSKGDVFITAALDDPRRPVPARVGVKQQRDQVDSTGCRNA